MMTNLMILQIFTLIQKRMKYSLVVISYQIDQEKTSVFFIIFVGNPHSVQFAEASDFHY